MTIRVYRALVALLLPSGFNDAFADELLSVYAEVDRGARLRRLCRGTASAPRRDPGTRPHCDS
jgi:hypothetical protein